MNDLVVAVAASLVALVSIGYLTVRVVQGLVLYRWMVTVKRYPNLAMALAMAAQGDDAEMQRFRSWVADSVERNGWDDTDAAVADMLRRVAPTLYGAAAAPVTAGAAPHRHRDPNSPDVGQGGDG